MKKLTSLLACGALALSQAACSNSQPAASSAAASASSAEGERTTLTVGATTSPHAIILEEAKDALADQGIDLKIVEFSDYPNINPSTSDGSLDANYFQHEPYLISYDEDNGYKSGDDGYLVSAGAIHYEPLGLYSEKHKSVDEIEDGATIVVPNDATNEARALYLLESLGWITLDEDATISTATVRDIVDNPKNLDIVEIAADQVASKLPDIDYGVINGNYALASGVEDKLLETEATDSVAAQTYQNVIAVKESRKDDPAIKALVDTLKSEEIKNFITEEFKGIAFPAK